MSHDDPPRWSSGDDSLARALRARRAEGPSDAQMDRLASNLGKASPSIVLPRWALPVGGAGVIGGAILIAIALSHTSKETPRPAARVVVSEATVNPPAPTPVVETAPAQTETPKVDTIAPTVSTLRPSGDRELALVKHAESVVATQPRAALDDTQTLTKQFPEGSYVEEREVVAIDALCRLDRVSEATTRASAFRARFPGSAYQIRIDRALDAAKDAQ